MTKSRTGWDKTTRKVDVYSSNNRHGRIQACVASCYNLFLSVCMSACLSVCMSVRLHVCPSACLSVCMSVRLHVCPSACLSVCMSVRLHVCPSGLVWSTFVIFVSFSVIPLYNKMEDDIYCGTKCSSNFLWMLYTYYSSYIILQFSRICNKKLSIFPNLCNLASVAKYKCNFILHKSNSISYNLVGCTHCYGI